MRVRMTTFSWKRKIGENISKDVMTKFSSESENEVVSNKSWVQSFKRKKLNLDENCKIKSEEFKLNGIKYAENQRLQEAVIEWNKALNLVPDDDKVLEMKAQALLQLDSPLSAVQAAERATRINPRWWVAFQTMGRCQLNLGELQMAKRSFCKAVHLYPVERELWDEDLKWTLNLLKCKNKFAKDEKMNETPHAIYSDGTCVANVKTDESKFVQCRF